MNNTEKIDAREFEIVGVNEAETEKISKPSLTFWGDAWRRFKQNKVALTFLMIVLFFTFIAIFGTFLTKYKYDALNLGIKLTKPFAIKGHILGTDDLGRDLFARLSQGIRVSMGLSLIVATICVIFGSLYGAIAAYFGGLVETIMIRIIEIVMSIPSLIYILLLMVIMGNKLETIIIALSLTRWLDYALLVRGEIKKLKTNEYVMASQSLGADFWWIVTKHLIPNTLSVIIVKLTIDIPQIIFTEAFLSYLGLGVPIPQASLGNLVKNGFDLVDSAPYLFYIPAITISLITLAFNVIGDALNDALNPKLRN